jgi:peptidoglycan hydrolase-like protein with peptidoglycan-binding domain
MSKLPLKRDDHGDLVKQMQGALIKKGFSCGPSATDGDFGKNTLSALEAFQDSAALTVQPLCDQKCWTALDLPSPKEQVA